MSIRHLLTGLLLLVVPAVVSAQRVRDTPEREGLIVRVDGPVTVAGGDTVGTLVVIGGNATIEGTVRGLVVISGTATVSGEVLEETVVARGHLEIVEGGVAGGDVMLYASTMNTAPGATLRGSVHNEPGISFSARASWWLWLSLTLVVIAGGLLFAGLGGTQLVESVRTMVHERWPTALGATIVVFGLPAAAMLAFITVVGIPLGLAIMFMLIPALAFLGYIITGTLLGSALIRRQDSWKHAGGKLYAEAMIGLLVLQLIAAIPLVGGLIAMFAAVVGAGALATRLWRIQRAGRGPAVPEQAELELQSV